MRRTREEVARKLTVALKARQDGLAQPPERQTIAQFLTKWLEGVRPSLRPKTYVGYEVLLRRHAVPSLGRIRLARLQPQHLQTLYRDRLAAGAAPMTVRHLHALLHRAFKDALRWGLVARNVTDLVDPPRATRPELRTLTQDESRRLLDSARGGRFEALYVLALTTGMRQGELLALRWRNLDLDSESLQILGSLQRTEDGLEILEPKTASSRRQISLTKQAVNALRRHRVAQAEERLGLGT